MAVHLCSITAPPLLHHCSTAANAQSFKDIKYSGERKTSEWTTTLCSPVQNTPRDFSSSDCQFKPRRKMKKASEKAKKATGSCGKEHGVLSMVLLSKHRAGSGAVTAAGTAPSTFLSPAWLEQWHPGTGRIRTDSQAQAELAQLFHRSRHPGAELENYNDIKQDVWLPRAWHLAFAVRSSTLPTQTESWGSPKTNLQGNHLKTITHQ